MATARIGASGQPIPMGGIGDILEGGRGYLGPGRLIPPVIGGGSAWGIHSLWNKITGGEDESEEDEREKQKNAEEATDWMDFYEKEKARYRAKEVAAEEESLKEEERLAAKETMKEIIRDSPMPEELKEEELIDQIAQEIVDSAEQKVKDGTPYKEAALEAMKEVIQTLMGTGSSKKHAQGGLVGINHLTRRL